MGERRRRNSWVGWGMTAERDKEVAEAEKRKAVRDKKNMEHVRLLGEGEAVGRRRRGSRHSREQVRKTVGERTIGLPLLLPFRISLPSEVSHCWSSDWVKEGRIR